MNISNLGSTSQTRSASNATDSNNTVAIKLEQIKKKLEAGQRSALKELQSLGIRYSIQEQINGEYIVDFTYNGKRYNAYYDPSAPKTYTNTGSSGTTNSNSTSNNTNNNTSPNASGNAALNNFLNENEGKSNVSSNKNNSNNTIDKQETTQNESVNQLKDLFEDLLDQMQNSSDSKVNIFSNSLDKIKDLFAEALKDEKINVPGNDASIEEAAGLVTTAIDEILEEKLDNIKNGHKNIHTEFGIDSNGNIVFQEASTKEVFDNIVNQVIKSIQKLETYGKHENILENIGGSAGVKRLVQTAWITSYNKFDSSKTNNTEEFTKEVLANLNKMMSKLQENPGAMEIFLKNTSYADKSITDGVTHYNTKTTAGGDETIVYKGSITQYDDGTIHISKDQDDVNYQTTMKEILVNLKTKYSSIDGETITGIFRNAQKAALEAVQGNKADCPYGTGCNSGRVEDNVRDWGGKDSRKGDDNKIDMDQLVQLTLYYFDKLLYQQLLV